MKSVVRFAKANPVLFLVIVSLAIRLLGAAVLDLKTDLLHVNFAAASSFENAQMGRGLLHTGNFHYYIAGGRETPSAYQPPFYPIFLAGVFSIFGDGTTAFIFVQLLQCALGVITVLLTFRLASRFLGESYGILAGLFTAFWPAFAYMPNEAHPISFLIPILLWISLLILDIETDNANIKRYAFLGLACGASMLIRSEIPAAFIILVAILGYRHRQFGPLAAMFCIGMLFAGGWILRNAHELGRPTLTTTAGLNMFRGYGPTATGGSYQWDGVIVWETPETIRKKKELEKHWSRDYESQLDGIYMDAAMDALRADPLRPFKLLPYKFLFYSTADFTHPKGKSPIVWLPWVILLPAIVYGMMRLYKERPDSWPLYFWVFFYMFIVLGLFALPRYRMNVEPMFLIFAVAGIRAWRDRKALAPQSVK